VRPRGGPTALALLVLGAACAAHPTFVGPTPAQSWTVTLIFAEMSVDDGRYPDADTALANFATRHAGTPEAVESYYWRALFALDPRNERRSGADAIQALDAYFAGATPRQHDAEASVLRRTAVALTTLRAANQEAASEADSARTRADSMRTHADSAQVAGASRDRSKDVEVQRLRDSLDKVVLQLTQTTQELERIKKRLATPQP
jgi:hypothetical protein